MRRWQHLFRSRRARDVMVAVVIGVPAAIGLLTGLHRVAPAPTPIAFGSVSALCAVVVALWRRELDWAATVVACATFALTDLPYAVYVMTYSLARRRRWPPSFAGTALLLVWPAHQALFEPITGSASVFEFERSLPANGLNGFVYWALAAAAPFVMGLAKNSLEDAMVERERHAVQSAERQQRLRESTRRERSLTERTRLASMMHDGVGHQISAMVTTAGAISVDAAATESIRQRCELIAEVGREAIGQLGEVLDVLSTADTDGGTARFGTADVEDLVRDYRSLGVDVSCQVEESTAGCDPITGDLCYRIIRESLANVLRHAGEPRADVRLTCTDDGTRLVVTSPLAPRDRPSLPGTGRGLRLLAEEAKLTGGSLTAGPAEDETRFVLRADLPPRGGDNLVRRSTS